MARIYLAARYSRREELCGYRSYLREMGHIVTSRWLDESHQISDAEESSTVWPDGDDGNTSAEAIALRQEFAEDDIEDVRKADIVISFTEPPGSSASRGGRHVEFGIALGALQVRSFVGLRCDERIIIVGYRENIFHWLPDVEFYETWEDAAIGLVGTPKSTTLTERLEQSKIDLP